MVKTALPRTRRAKIGDVLEIGTINGLAYFQYTHQHPVYGGLIRVLPGTHDERPPYFTQMAGGAERYFVFSPVRAASSRGLVSIVSHESVPERARAFPLFKAGHSGNWWLWDGQTEWRVAELTPPSARCRCVSFGTTRCWRRELKVMDARHYLN
jgi:hypothetical protein